MSRKNIDVPRITIGGASSEPAFAPISLGARVRSARKRQHWTLKQASERTGLAVSTLSKIENEQMSPTFDLVCKLARGLGLDVPQLFTASDPGQSTGRRAITRQGGGIGRPTTTYEHELLSTEITGKRMLPFKTVVRARSFEDFSGWVRHDGEEFMLVLEGAVIFYSEFYEPVRLGKGDSIYYDSSMGHACVSSGRNDALILWVCTTH